MMKLLFMLMSLFCPEVNHLADEDWQVRNRASQVVEQKKFFLFPKLWHIYKNDKDPEARMRAEKVILPLLNFLEDRRLNVLLRCEDYREVRAARLLWETPDSCLTLIPEYEDYQAFCRVCDREGVTNKGLWLAYSDGLGQHAVSYDEISWDVANAVMVAKSRYNE